MNGGRNGAAAMAGLTLLASILGAPAATTAGGGPPAIPVPDAGPASESGVILVLGDSLSAGLGVPPEAAFPALLEERIDARGWDYRVVNAGVSGDTSSGGLARLDWLLRQPLEVLVLELGANDGLRGLDPTMTRTNLQAIIRRTRERHPEADVVLAGMRVPPNLGSAYAEAFRQIFPDLAAAEDVHLVPFLLEGVAADPELNLPDGIHPNRRGHRIVADNVWEVLEPILARRVARRDAASPDGGPSSAAMGRAERPQTEPGSDAARLSR